mgnify:CR=1 FL=1
MQLIYYSVFFQAEDGIRDLVRSRGLGDVYKRQGDEEMTVAEFMFTLLAVDDLGFDEPLFQNIYLDLSLIHI